MVDFQNKIEDISKAKSDALAAHVVLYKSLGIGKAFALECMKELAKRRKDGDDFNFELYIDDEVAKIPKPALTTIPPVNIAQLLKSVIK